MTNKLGIFIFLLFLSSCGTRYSTIKYHKVDRNVTKHLNKISTDNKSDTPKSEISFKPLKNAKSETCTIQEDYPISNSKSADIASQNEIFPLIIEPSSINKNKGVSAFSKDVSSHKSQASNQSKSEDPYVKSEAARAGGTIGMLALLIAAILGLLILVFLGEPWQLILAMIGMAALISSIIYFMQRLFRKENSNVTNKRRWIIALSIGFGSMAVLTAVLLGLSWF
jgi:hypothetical protein